MSDQPIAPDNTKHSEETDIHAPGGIRTHNPSNRAAIHGTYHDLIRVKITQTYVSGWFLVYNYSN
jgi:hypothetical protein